MDGFQHVIALWGSVSAFAADLGVNERTAMSWWQRKSIPSEWFAAVVRSAERRGFIEVTAEKLALIAEARRFARKVA